MNATIVFAGPTITAAEIKHYLPHAWVHAPIECGDLLRVLRLHPKRLIIIDGYYEHKASVWHKEILLALQQGVEVIGCASLGALRAAELYQFGMKGIGQIFNGYFEGVLTDDDEVAVLHLDAAHGYQEMTVPMVNIRATLLLACQQGIIDEALAKTLVQQAKELFYAERNYHHLNINPNLRDWLNKHYINQKHLDAIEALDWAANNPPSPVTISHPLQHTVYLKRLTLQCNASAFSQPYDWLPQDEQEAITAQPHGVQQFAMILNLVDCITQAEGDTARIHQWLHTQKEHLNLSLSAIKTCRKLLHAFFPEMKSSQVDTFAVIFLILDGLLTERSIYCKNESVSHYRQWLRRHLDLNDNEMYLNWLKSKHLDDSEMTQMTKKIARYRFAYQYFIGLFLAEINYIAPKNWLNIANKINFNQPMSS